MSQKQLVIAELFELTGSEREHLRRYIRFMNSTWCEENVPDDLFVNQDLSELLIDKYVEWVKAGEPT